MGVDLLRSVSGLDTLYDDERPHPHTSLYSRGVVSASVGSVHFLTGGDGLPRGQASWLGGRSDRRYTNDDMVRIAVGEDRIALRSEVVALAQLSVLVDIYMHRNLVARAWFGELPWN